MIAGDPIPVVMRDRRVLLFALLAAVGVLFWPTTESLLAEWLDTDKRVYAHGLLMVAASAYLLLRAFPRPELLQIEPSYPAMAAAALLSAAWLVAYRAGLQVVHQALLPPLLYLGVHGMFGAAAARRAFVPIFLIYSVIPVWDLGVGILQSLTVAVVEALLQICGVTSFIVGNFVHIPNGVFEVEEGCAGLHYFVVAATIAALYGELQRDTVKVRLQLLMLAMALALVANWIRVFVVVVAGYLTDMQHYLVRVDHYYFGWALFAVAMAVFFLLARRFPIAPDQRALDPAELAAPTRSIRAHTVVALSVLALAAGPVYSMVRPVTAAEDADLSLPVGTSQWSGPNSCNDIWQPVHAGADERRMGEYRAADQRVCLYEATYLQQRQGKEAVNYGNALYGAEMKDVEDGGVVRVGSLGLRELRGSDTHGRDYLLWSYFTIDRYATSHPLAAQLRYAFASLGSTPVSRVVAIRAVCTPHCDETRTALRDFVQSVALPATESRRASN